jgi:hypothetical protein
MKSVIIFGMVFLILITLVSAGWVRPVNSVTIHNYTFYNNYTYYTVNDTNETTRMNNLLNTNCSGQVLAYFYPENGTGICEADDTGAGGSGGFTLLDNLFLNNVSGVITFNRSYADIYYYNKTSKVGNTTAEIQAVKVNNATWADGTSTYNGVKGNTTAEIWAVCSNNTFLTNADLINISSGGFNNWTDIGVNRIVLNSTSTITYLDNSTFGYWQNASCIVIGDTTDKSLC